MDEFRNQNFELFIHSFMIFNGRDNDCYLRREVVPPILKAHKASPPLSLSFHNAEKAV
jgi:hypothetical protein